MLYYIKLAVAIILGRRSTATDQGGDCCALEIDLPQYLDSYTSGSRISRVRCMRVCFYDSPTAEA